MLSLIGCGNSPVNETQNLKWFKGNLHTHTNLNHGDAPPEFVLDWYLENDYDFVVISDHNLRFDNPGLIRKGEKELLVVAGEEVSIANNSIHIGAIHIERAIPEEMGKMKPEQVTMIKTRLQTEGRSEAEISGTMSYMGVLQQFTAVTRDIEAQGGIAVFNHPSMSVKPALFENLPDIYFFELLNPRQDSLLRTPRVEKWWDKALAGGRELYAVSGDDAHQFISVRGTHPGTTWVWVRAAELTAQALVSAMKRGDFYISTGIQLKRLEYRKDRNRIAVEIAAETGKQYTVQFIGKNGTLLKEVTADRAEYTCAGDELYVRVRIFDQQGQKAYTQAFKVQKTPSP